VHVRLLGTGSADGWPNPFCACGSCTDERRDGRSRAPSSALVDEVVLIDCGPTTPHPSGGAVSLRGVEHVLVTHGHPDHLHPAFLLSRAWATPDRPLHVWAPPRAIDLCRDWLAPDTDVVLHAIGPGDDLVLDSRAGTYRVRVLPAAHAHRDGDVLAQEAVLFAIAGPDDHRLLYATDTGPLPDTTLDALEGPFALVLVDETFGDLHTHGTGHLDLATLPPLLDRLRQRGCVTAQTVVVATHLSHHNPPTRDLRVRLAAFGVEVRDDLDLIDTARPLGRHRLLLGGARSGKSRLAERWAARGGPVTYVATGGRRPDDPEWEARVAAHRARRPADWRTVETSDVVGILDEADRGTVVLVDCLALWLTALLDQVDAWSRTEAGDESGVRADCDGPVADLVRAVRDCRADVILVSNEVGMGVVPATASGRLFRDLLGLVNMRVGDACDETTLVVAGHATTLGPTSVGSPHD
jgi:adenosylcobinamide kinase / adenosylcobinamide-phosphate guanylyltransferase